MDVMNKYIRLIVSYISRDLGIYFLKFLYLNLDNKITF